MKQFIFIISVFLIFLSCRIKNKTIYNERVKNDILIGECNKKAFENLPFNKWYKTEYENYNPNSLIIEKLSKINKKDIKILIIMGTWCHDSQRELPRFYRIIDEIGFPISNIKMTAVDLHKKSQNNKLDNVEFTRIPTFIFYKNKIEIGRIVESTKKNLEEDMLNIIN